MSTHQRGGVTIRDVARRAGVSVTAVSHAINGKGTLSAETREHIKVVAASMNYRADALARGLRRAPLGVVGFVIRPLDALGEYRPEGVDVFLRVASAAAAAALDAGLGLMLVPDLTRTPLPPLALSLDGYIVMNPVREDPVVALLRSHDIEYVTLGRDPSHPENPAWVSNDDRGNRAALADLERSGVREVLYLGGTAHDAWNLDSEELYRAWCTTTGRVPRVVHLPEGAGTQGAEELVPSLLEGGAPEAIFCLTGRHAAGVVAGLSAAGVRCPEQILVVTGSDAEQARTSRPAISAVDLQPEALGTAIVGMLKSVLDGAPPQDPVLLASRYRRRGSSRRN
ncbi:MAG: LacI family transcriptional regulator [Arthrobacter sp.]|jgi:DNA-binding LacI/PurR family transcriptional regulator|nr:LacI family transcriptional regulator [Arthrobacter sp.]